MKNLTEGFEDLARLDPPSWVVKLAWALWMAFILAIVIAAMSAPAWAAPVFKANKNGQFVSLRLLNTRCSDAAVLKHMLSRVRPELLEQFKNARLHWEGKDWASCWIEFDGVVYSIDEEGSPLQPIPRSEFRDDTV